ncbi:BED-type domain-containing protein [Aphelenchoides bicaudatus]|nr:BED-type domain-containing protein [Aphelenchoides bicaudatus]
MFQTRFPDLQALRRCGPRVFQLAPKKVSIKESLDGRKKCHSKGAGRDRAQARSSSPCPSQKHSPLPTRLSSDTPASTITTNLNVSVNSSPRIISQQNSSESSASSSSTHTTSASLSGHTGSIPIDNLARIERGGRALRKSAAIDSEDHVLTTSNPLLHQQPQPIQPPPFQLAGLPSTDSLAAAVAQLTQNGAVTQPGLLVNAGNLQSLAAIFSSQQQLGAVKQEQILNDDFLKLVSSNPDLFSGSSNWMGLNNINPLANLSLIQPSQQQTNNETGGLTSTALSGAGDSLDTKLSFDMARNQLSTESSGSTGALHAYAVGGVLPPTTGSNALTGAEQIPRKQDIQNDIRHNKGRFELVRKRGRSEVWNLFGQVVDKQTGNRLPYVACYACKVLYTDTGGGTGNMTRHRCSVGSSYRSYGSSLDTLGETQSSSFDTSHAINGPNSPDNSQESQQHNTTTLREAFANSSGYHTQTGSLGSSGYGSAYASASLESLSDNHRNFFRSSSAGNSSSISSVTSLLHPSSAVQPPPILQRSGSSNLAAGPTTPVISLTGPQPLNTQGGSRSQVTSPNPLQQAQNQQPQLTTLQLGQTFKPTPTRPASYSHLYRHPHSPHTSPAVIVTGAGYVFTQQDKQLFTQAVIEFCAKDLHNWDVVSGEGFKNLIETVLFIGRRSHGDTQVTNSFDPVRNLIPDPQQLREVFMAKEMDVQQATMQDLAGLKDAGISLSCQRVHLGGQCFICVNANYLTEDWQMTRRCVKVHKCENTTPTAQQYFNVALEVIEENQLANAKLILLTFDSEFDDEEKLVGLPENIVILKNIARALNKILVECFLNCPDKENTTSIVDLCKRVIRHLLEKEVLLKELPPALSYIRLKGEDAQPFPDDYIVSIYLMLKFVKENLIRIHQTLETTGGTGNFYKIHNSILFVQFQNLLSKIQQIDWSRANEIEQFLAIFYETVKEFNASQEPMLQKSVTECLALLHELRQPNEHSDSEHKEMPSSARLERTKSIESTKAMADPSNWFQEMSRSAEKLLRTWTGQNLRPEYYMGTVLEPRYKQLQLICNDIEKVNVYNQLREAAGLYKLCKEQQSKQEGEPSRKRRNFLMKLEDYAMAEDELENYIRTPLSQLTTKSVLEFWSSHGELNFPSLARFARFILGTQCSLNVIRLHLPSTKLGADDIGTLLKLRPEHSQSTQQ